MKIEGIILAAGLSSRAGSYKLLFDIFGKTVLERCIEGMYETCSRIILVGGYKINKLLPLTNKYSKIELIENVYYNDGMFSSVIKGCKHASGDRVFITPGDYPFIEKEIYKKLLGVDSNIVIPTYQGAFGHPVLMGKSVMESLLDHHDFRTLRDFVFFYGYKTLDVGSSGILFDIDLPGDFSFALSYFLSCNQVAHGIYSDR